MIFHAILTNLCLHIWGPRAAKPGKDAAGQKTLWGSSGWEETAVSLTKAEYADVLGPFFTRDEVCGIEFIQSSNVHPSKSGAGDNLNSFVVDGEWWVTGLLPPEVDDQLLGLLDIQS